MTDLGMPDGIYKPGDPVGNDGLTDAERHYLANRYRERIMPTPDMARRFNAWLQQKDD
ncbi:hypothetical protein [Microbacterium sp. ProA8]|uniref:hypothetical protein n=1 Tax=Microbacterium chionoecetis TaxID=3153754 RepID=UPI003264D191